jgi:Family of unknown function (DUF6328)
MSENQAEKTGEDPQERTARELIELLQELRIVIPGVQVLFAFLLTVPFSQGFSKLDSLQRDVFFATLMCTAATTALLIAPSSHHRLLFRQGVREQRVKMGNLLAILGLVFLVPAMVGVLFVITDLIFGTGVAIVTTAVVTIVFVLLWFVLPLRFRGNNYDKG